MSDKKKCEIAKRIAIIAYILENRPTLDDIKGDAKILDHILGIADMVGGIKMLNTARLYLEELRMHNGMGYRMPLPEPQKKGGGDK